MLYPVSHTIFNVVEMDTEVVDVHVHLVRVGARGGGHSHVVTFGQGLQGLHLPQLTLARLGRFCGSLRVRVVGVVGVVSETRLVVKGRRVWGD